MSDFRTSGGGTPATVRKALDGLLAEGQVIDEGRGTGPDGGGHHLYRLITSAGDAPQRTPSLSICGSRPRDRKKRQSAGSGRLSRAGAGRSASVAGVILRITVLCVELHVRLTRLNRHVGYAAMRSRCDESTEVFEDHIQQTPREEHVVRNNT